MALFRRRTRHGPDDRIADFWHWWSTEGRLTAEQSIEGQLDPASFADTMTARVRSCGRLAWELAPGETSEHVLVVTAEGDPVLRAAARRVVLAAPDADETWSYLDTRPPTPDPESVLLSVDGEADLDFSRVRVAARLNGARFDVQVHHPAFPDLPPEVRAQVTFQALDAALGEVDTEVWLGEVTPAEMDPLDGFGLVALRSVVRDLKGRYLDADGNPGWAVLGGDTPQGPLVAVARSPLHPLTAPNLDTHVAVVVPYDDRTSEGLPGEDALEALRRLEERLAARLGAQGQIVAHQSNAGVRTLHLYLDSAAGLLGEVKDVARSWDQGKATVHEMLDPGWDAVTHLRS